MYSDNVDKDKFYTCKEVAIQCINSLDLNEYDCVIEPSAGSGAFSKNIIHNNLIALDLEPEQEDIIRQDWFDFKLIKQYKKILVIGNPPFGKRNVLSKKFIEKSIEIGANDICFILPNVFHKYTLQSVFPKEYKLKSFIILPKDSFRVNENPYHVPCTFFHWTKDNCEDLRYNSEKYRTNDFEFITKSEATIDDFFILGASPNRVKEMSEVSETNRGYYIRPNEKNKNNLTNLFKTIDFKGMSSVNGGVSWRTKTEIIKSYIESCEVNG